MKDVIVIDLTSSNKSKLEGILKKFRDAVANGKAARIEYSDYKMLQGFFERENCTRCGGISYFNLDANGSIECPDCNKAVVTKYISPFIANELAKFYNEVAGNVEEEDEEDWTEAAEVSEPVMSCRAVRDPNSGIERIIKVNENINEVEGENAMMNFNVNGLLKGLQFGMISGDQFKLSPKGIAFKSNDGYVVYNTKTGELTDVTGMVFDMDNAVFAMPVAQSKVKVDDIIIHAGKTVVVEKVSDRSLIVVSPFDQEVKEVIPAKSMFGFNFYTKLTPLFDMGGADEENPFGNMMPLMLMSDPNMMNNPMAMMAMMGGDMFGSGDGDKKGLPKEMMMAMAMSQMGQPAATNGPNTTAQNPMNNMMMAMAMSKMF